MDMLCKSCVPNPGISKVISQKQLKYIVLSQAINSLRSYFLNNSNSIAVLINDSQAAKVGVITCKNRYLNVGNLRRIETFEVRLYCTPNDAQVIGICHSKQIHTYR